MANSRKVFQDPYGPYQTTRQRTPSPNFQTPSMSGSMNSQGFPFVYDGRYSPPPPSPFGFPHPHGVAYYTGATQCLFYPPGFSPPHSPYFSPQTMHDGNYNPEMGIPVYLQPQPQPQPQPATKQPSEMRSNTPKGREAPKGRETIDAPKVQISPEEIKYTSFQKLLHGIESIVESHDAYIFGKYVIDSLRCNDMRKKFYKFMSQKKFDANQTNALFYDRKVINTLANRLDLPTIMDILCSQQQYDKLLKQIKAMFSDSSIYKIEDLERCHDIMKLSKFKDTVNMEDGRTISLLSYRITVCEKPLVLNLYVSTKGPSTIPLGFFTKEEDYIISNGNGKYVLYYPGAFEANRNSDHNIDRIISEIIDTPSNSTIMFGVDYDKHLPGLFKDSKTTTEPQTYDFKTSASTSSHFTITNGPIMKPCAKCSVPFVKNSSYAVTKCCGEAYHFDCLLQNYLERNRRVSFNCSKEGCTTHNTLDVGSKNVEILMILSGFLY